MSQPSEQRNGSNQMDELRHVQLLLKREEIFNEFQASEIKELNLSLRCESQKVLYYQKFLIFLHMCAMGDRAVKLTPAFFDSLFKEIPDKLQSQTPSVPNLVTHFNKVISTFSEEYELLAKACERLTTTKPDLVEQLSFSTIPGLFGYLWSSEFAESFNLFMEKVVAISMPTAVLLSRVIYSLPSFRLFFEAVMSELVNRVTFVSDSNSADSFVEEFLFKWKDNASFCPSIVKKIISHSKDPEAFLFESFFKPSFQSPRVFGIVPNSLRIGSQPTDLILASLRQKIPLLWKAIAEVENPATLPSSEKLSKILNDLGKSALFTSDDLSVLAELVGFAIQIKPDFPVKPNQLDQRAESPDYLAYSFTLPSVQDVQPVGHAKEAENDEELIEFQLRTMLTGVDVIPLAAQSSDSPDMVELLKSQVQLARPDHRLLLEMKIDDFETARKKVPQFSTFKSFLDLLRTKFDQRQPQRLDKLSKISLYNTEYSQMVQLSKGLKKSIEFYRDVIRFHLVEAWLKEKNPLETINDSLCVKCSDFVTFFTFIVKEWKKWCDERKYKLTPSYEILHNIVMRELPLERFLKMNPDDERKDTVCHQGIINKKEELLRQNTFDFTSTFQTNPKLLEAAQRQLQQAFDAPLPLLKLHYFGEALNTLVFVLTFEGHREVGADQWLPMAILLLVLAEPKRLPSTIKYIEHFVKSLTDDPQSTGELRLINEQTDYIFTMVKSSLMHFQKNIDGLGESE